MTGSPSELRTHRGQRAGLVSRFVADAVDLGVVIAVVAVCYLAVGSFKFVLRSDGFRWPIPGALPLGTVAWVVLVLYLAAGWSGTGRSVGKQLMGLRVVAHRGGRLTFGVALLRSLICVVFPFGLLWCAVSRESRSLADEILRTSVVYDWRPHVPPQSAP